MKKKAREKMKKVWNLQFEFNKILWMLSHAMAVFFGESDRSVNLGEKYEGRIARDKRIFI